MLGETEPPGRLWPRGHVAPEMAELKCEFIYLTKQMSTDGDNISEWMYASVILKNVPRGTVTMTSV